MNPLYLMLSLLIWLILGVVIAYFARQQLGEGISEFFLANRKLGGFIAGMTYSATTYSAFMMIGLVGLTYATGVGALGFEITYLIFTIILLAIFAPRFWVAGKRFGYVTPPELLAGRYNNKWVGIIAAVICLVMLIPYASVQLMGVGYLLEGLTPSSIQNMYFVGILIAATFSGFAALWAGMKSVSWTDSFQALIMISASIILVLFVFFHFFGSPSGFVTDISNNHPELLKLKWDFKMFIGLALPWAFFAITNPQVSQRMFVSDSSKSLKRMIIYFSIFGLIYTVITTLLGLSVAGISSLSVSQPDKAMPVLLNNIPVILALVVFIGIFAAATSTLSSIVLTLSSLGSRDLVKGIKPKISEKLELYSGKLIILVILVSCVVFANLKFDLIAILSSMASGGLLVMAPTIVGAFFWKRSTAKGAIVSMAVGGLFTASLYIAGESYYPLGWWPSFWGLLVTVIIFVIVSLITQPPEDTEEFFEEIDEGIKEHGMR